EALTAPAELTDFIADGEFTITISPYSNDWRPAPGTIEQGLVESLGVLDQARRSVGRFAELAQCTGQLSATGLEIEPFAEFRPSFVTHIDISSFRLQNAEFRIRGELESGL